MQATCQIGSAPVQWLGTPVLAVNLSPPPLSPGPSHWPSPPKPWVRRPLPGGTSAHPDTRRAAVGCRLVRLTSRVHKWSGEGPVVSLSPTNVAGHHHGTARVVAHSPGPWEGRIGHGNRRRRLRSREFGFQPPDSLLFPCTNQEQKWTKDGDFC